MRFRIDWNKPSHFGWARVGPPPAWLMVAAIAVFAALLLLSQAS